MLIGLALIGGVVLLIAGGGSGSGSKTSPQVAALQSRFLKHTVAVPDKGISVRRPASWKDSKTNGVVSLQSHDRCLLMTLAAPGAASGANSLHDNAIAALKLSLGGAKVRPTPNGQQVGGIPTRSNTLTSTKKGSQTRVLLSVGKGDKYTYLTEVVLGSPACQDDLRLANLVLTSVEYTK